MTWHSCHPLYCHTTKDLLRTGAEGSTSFVRRVQALMRRRQLSGALSSVPYLQPIPSSTTCATTHIAAALARSRKHVICAARSPATFRGLIGKPRVVLTTHKPLLLPFSSLPSSSQMTSPDQTEGSVPITLLCDQAQTPKRALPGRQTPARRKDSTFRMCSYAPLGGRRRSPAGRHTSDSNRSRPSRG